MFSATKSAPAVEAEALTGGESTSTVHNPSPEQAALLLSVIGRRGWQSLTPLQQQRAYDFFSRAEWPQGRVVTSDIERLSKLLGWTQGQRQHTVAALKRAGLLYVNRRTERLPNGRVYTVGKATYCVPFGSKPPPLRTHKRPLQKARHQARRRSKSSR